MNTFTINGTVTSLNGTFKTIGSLNRSLTLTGDNTIAESITVTASLQQIDLTKLSDYRYGYFLNANDSTTNTGSITLTSDSGGLKVLTVLQAGDVALLPNSGSVSIYAKTDNALSGSSTLQYTITES